MSCVCCLVELWLSLHAFRRAISGGSGRGSGNSFWSRGARVDETLWNTLCSLFPAAYPGAEKTTPFVIAVVEALQLSVSVHVVERESGFGVTVSCWVVGDDAYCRG